jgi:hypothetical protein
MWRRRMTRRAPTATRLTMTSPHRGEARESISNRSTSSKGEKSSRVALRVEGSYYTIKGGSLQIRGGRDDAIIIFAVTGSGVFGRRTI